MTHIEQRIGNSALWTSTNPILHKGEAGHEDNTGKWKLGDGVTAWNALPYKSGVDSVAGRTGAVVLGVADVSGAAPKASPVFTGDPKAPTPSTSDNDTTIATTAYVKAQFVDATLTGVSIAPTVNKIENSARIATTAYVKSQLVDTVLTGSPTAPTPPSSDNDTSIATTAFVKSLDIVPLGRYDNNFSLIPFGGMPANNTRYTLNTWNVAIPARSMYATVHITCEAYGNGAAEATWWMAAALDGGGYSDLMTSVHTNGAVPTINMPANLMTSIHMADATTLSVRLAGRASAGAGYASVSTFMANVHITFMGY